jgi:bifunctional non-homologous end joining protein LigD
VFLDVNMNREGANIASAYSVRPEPGATVSTPFTWDELGDVRPEHYTIATILERVATVEDPFLPVAEGPGQNLVDALEQVESSLPKKKGGRAR